MLTKTLFSCGLQPLSRLCTRLLCVVALATLPFAAQAQTAQQGGTALPRPQSPSQSGSLAEQGVLKEQHGDWRILCEAAAGPGAQRCALVQNVESADRPGFGLVVMILKTPDGKTRMRVAAPLGIFLPPGLGLRVDGEVIGNAPFWFCRPFACETEAIVTSELMQRMQSGNEALFVLFERPEKGTGLVVSLTGFTAGHSALATWQPPAGQAPGTGTQLPTTGTSGSFAN